MWYENPPSFNLKILFLWEIWRGKEKSEKLISQNSFSKMAQPILINKIYVSKITLDNFFENCWISRTKTKHKKMFENFEKKIFARFLEIPLLFFQKNSLTLYTTIRIFYHFLVWCNIVKKSIYVTVPPSSEVHGRWMGFQCLPQEGCSMFFNSLSSGCFFKVSNLASYASS